MRRCATQAVAVLAFACPVVAQQNDSIRTGRSGESDADSVIWTDSTLFISPPESTSFSNTAKSRLTRWLRSSVRLSGGIELGRALSNTTSDSSGIVLNAPSRPSTTLTGSAMLEWSRLTLIGLGGTALSQTRQGSFGRVAGVFDAMRSIDGTPLWQFGADYTTVRSPRVPTLTSSGLSMRVGNPRQLQAGVRYGARSRAVSYTPVTSIDVGRTTSWWLSHKTLMTAQLSANGVWTRAPTTRGFPVETDEVFQMLRRPRENVMVSDLILNLQLARGAWAVAGRAVQRFGRSPTIWDDPIPSEDVWSQTADGRTAAIMRLLWVPMNNFMIAAEGGRQLSDPVYGLSSVRYASLSVRMSFEVGNRRAVWHKYDVLERTSNGHILFSNVPVATLTQEENGQYLLVIPYEEGKIVEIAADFTNWTPIPLEACPKNARVVPQATQADSVTLKRMCKYFGLQSGVYHILYRVDGGAWQVPAGLTPVDDDFNGRTGLLIVP